MLSTIHRTLIHGLLAGLFLLTTNTVWAQPNTHPTTSPAPAASAMTANSATTSAADKSAIVSVGKFETPALKLETRPAYGAAAGKAHAFDIETVTETDRGWIVWVFWAAMAVVLLGTLGVAYQIGQIKNPDGSATRGLTLGSKLTLGFGGLATLLLMISALSIAAQQEASRDITELTRMSNNTELLDSLQQDMLMVRMKVKDFLISNSNEDLQAYSDYLATVTAKLEAAQKSVRNPERLKLLQSIETDLQKYTSHFNEVVMVVDQRNGTINSQINPAAQRFTDLLNEIARTAAADGDHELANQINEVGSLFLRARVSNLTFMRTNDAQFARMAIDQVTQAGKDMDALATRVQNPKRKVWMSEAAGACNFYADRLESNIAVVQRRHELVNNHLDVIGPQIAATGHKIIESQNISQAQLTQEASDAANSSLITAIVVCVVALIVAVSVGVLLIRSTTASVNKVLNVLRAIASGDLTQEPLRMTSKDEMGELARATDKMSDSLTELVSQVSQATREVASAATQIAASSEEMATGMKEQTDQVSQVSAAIEEMSQSIVEVAKKSGEAASNAGESGKTAQDGGQIVDKTIDGMSSISQAVTASASAVQELGKRGEQIGAIIKVINDIADQTNLLALNAAIEAARAGEHGRGFAVVADEVRKLADRTTKATEEIAGSIQAIQTETGQAVERMNAGTKEVEQGVHLATDAGKSLAQIVTAAQNVASMIQSIAAAAEQQSSASEEISRNIEAISAVTKQANEGAGQAAAAAAQLSSKAEQLQVLVSRFRMRNQDRVNTPTSHPTPTRSGNPGSTQAPSHRSPAQGTTRHAA